MTFINFVQASETTIMLICILLMDLVLTFYLFYMDYGLSNLLDKQAASVQTVAWLSAPPPGTASTNNQLRGKRI